MKPFIKEKINDNINVKKKMLNDEKLLQQIETLVTDICVCINNGGKILFAGNGGSFSDAFHFAGELVGRFLFDREPLPAIALGGNNASVTAIGNDYCFEDIFVRELKALGKAGDVFIGITTSGNSQNIIKAVEIAQKKDLVIYILTGKNAGRLKNICECICGIYSVKPVKII